MRNTMIPAGAKGLAVAAALALAAPSAHAAVTISVVGDGSGYDVAHQPAYLSTDVNKTYDLDGDNVYGSAGYLMFGADDGQTSQSAQPFTDNVNLLPSWISASPGADFVSVAYGFGTYAAIDDPTAGPGVAVADWSPERSGIALATAGGVGAWDAIADFTINADTPRKFRVGVMAGNEHNSDGRWDPTGIRLVGPDGSIASVTSLPISTPFAAAGWVFFDVDTNGATSGTFTILGEKRLATQGPSIGGFTFDAFSDPNGQIVNFDFGAGLTGGAISNYTDNTVDYDANAAGDTWNGLGNFAGLSGGVTAGNGTLGTIQDINGNNTALTITISGVIGQDTTNANLPTAGQWDETVLDVPDAAMDGHYYGPVLTYVIDGLDPNSTGHTIEILRAFNVTDVSDITVNGVGPVAHERLDFFANLDEAEALVRFLDIQADALGRITIVSDRQDAGNSMIQAIRLVIGPATVVPAPAALPAGLAMGALLATRRRRR